MTNPPPYTWKPFNYTPATTPPPPPPTPILLAMPVLVAPCIAVAVKPAAPLKDIQVSGQDNTAKGKEMVVTETKTTVKGTSTKTVTRSVAKAVEEGKDGSKAGSKAESKAELKAESKVSSKAPSTAKPPSKPASATPANSITSSKKPTSATAKTSAAVVLSKTIVSASTSLNKKSASTTSATTSQKAAKAKAISALTPPLPGMKVLYPKYHTCIHIFLRAKVWELPTASATKLIAKMFFVPCSSTPNELIEQLRGATTGKEEEKCKGWGFTEVQEQGDGRWTKGGCVVYGEGRGQQAIRGLGWTEVRGGERPPVWVVLGEV